MLLHHAFSPGSIDPHISATSSKLSLLQQFASVLWTDQDFEGAGEDILSSFFFAPQNG